MRLTVLKHDNAHDHGRTSTGNGLTEPHRRNSNLVDELELYVLNPENNEAQKDDLNFKKEKEPLLVSG
ncbi:hypothetical protein A4A49_26854 [Nicotiana attenuata]|uniref:Uncharacterized protein n=1 Tax=Nicotiana attenuata TaxID=49451 RepID=A0A1J6K4U1_NICAT|nr:hypothetical protein A4A49_26854 [Nicotiana attenuata]